MSGAEVVRRQALDPRDRHAMLALMEAHFEGVDPEAFEADLAEKDWVVLLRDAAGALGGFSTVRHLAVDTPRGRHHLLFSGDTIVDASLRTRPALAGAFGHLFLALGDALAPEPLSWFLISKGYRTYRFLPLNFLSFWPRFDAPTPPEAQALLDQVGRMKFGPRYDAKAGVVRAHADRLRPELLAVPEGRAQDPHVRFFLDRNPGHVHGEELACLASLARENLTPLARAQVARLDMPPLELGGSQ